MSASAAPFRIGQGFDLHRLEPGHPLVIAGVRLPHDRGCVAHSDGDVVLHALTDALLGAVAAGDIGALFPDTDAAWAGADSAQFVEAALREVAAAGYALVNVDLTVVLERPKLRPHIDRMRDGLAGLLDLPVDRVSVKAKTHERVDAVGRGDAVVCQATALVASL